MIRTTVLGAIAFAALATGACAKEGFDPALFVVRDADSTMYLYGTVHVRPRGTDWGDQDVREALASADEVWTEIEISPQADERTQALAMRLGAAPADRPLSSWLTPDENEDLDSLTVRLGVPRAYLETMRPWMAGLTLSLLPIMRAGYDPASGVDRAIDAYGEANGKTMRAFETPELQMSFFAGLDDETQRAFLREAIEEAEQGPAMIAEMTTAWEQGDLETLERSVIEDTREHYPGVYEALFVRRNAAWMEVLTHELAGSGVDFVAVGAGHLLGPDGLVRQLQARGYTVERVGE
jgi:uncharacterized protein YbaP (TraB family)